MLTAANVPAVMLADTIAGEAVTPTSSLALLDVFAAVRRLSDGVASMPLVLYRKTADGRERAEHPSAELLRRPAPATTLAALVGTIVAHLATYGNSYVGKVKAPEGQVVQLITLAPDRVIPEVRAGVPIWTYTDLQGRVQVLTSDPSSTSRRCRSTGSWASRRSARRARAWDWRAR